MLEVALGKYVEAAIIAALLVFNAALGLFQESRAQATLAALRSRLALSLRPARWRVKTIQAAGLVPGDIVKLSPSTGAPPSSGPILCADKTGTLTENALTVTVVRPMPGFDEAHVLGLAALASSDGGQDPVDGAIRSAASGKPVSDAPKMIKFVPFDPATKMSEATATNSTGSPQRIVKGASAMVIGLAQPSPTATAAANELEAKGFRVLAVAVGSATAMKLAGLDSAQRPASPRLGGAYHRVAQIGRAHRDGDGRRAGDRGHRGEGGGARWRYLSARADP